MQTQVVKLDSTSIDAGKIRQAAHLVDSGQLVIFPAETVYGIACAGMAESISKLSCLKGRGAEKRYTLHIAQKDDVYKYVPSISLREQKLIKNAWPGPVTVVFKLNDRDLSQQHARFGTEIFENLYKNGSIGVRCPDNRIASMLLEMTQNPVVAPSANLTGHNPAVDAPQALSQFSGRVGLVLDGGPTRYKKSSTVVKIGKANLDLLRTGVYSRSDLDSMSRINFLLLCTGNICRSPMAAGIFDKYLAEKWGCELDRLEERGYKVSSAGIIDSANMPASEKAVKVCAGKGVDISGHRSRILSRQLVDESDFIFVMEQMHFERIREFGCEASKKCMLLADGRQIPDPIGQSQQVYDRCAEMIEEAVRKRIGELTI